MLADHAKSFCIASIALAWLLLSSGCASIDAPSIVVGNSSILGVRVESAKPPFNITSVSIRHSADRSSLRWSEKAILADSVLVQKGCIEDSCWQILAVPAVAHALKLAAEQPCQQLPNSYLRCGMLDWGTQFAALKKVQSYLLNGHSRAWDLTIYLISNGDRFDGSFTASGTHRIKLSFVFDYPVADETGRVSRHRMERYVPTVVPMVGYELQHVAFAAGLSRGPGDLTSTASLVKNEANSACWQYVVLAYIVAGTDGAISVSAGSSEKDVRRIYGSDLPPTSAAVIGPALVNHALYGYLVDREPLLGGANDALISGRNSAAIKRVMSFCRAFTRYPGSILDKPMPIPMSGDFDPAQE